MIKKLNHRFIEGEILIPSSKSDAQRAILIASLGKDISTLYNVGESDDEKAMLQAIIDLGAKVINSNNNSLKISGGFKFNTSLTLNMNESGLAFRLLTCICALSSEEIILKGRGSLNSRNMQLFETILPEFGVKVKTNNGLLPLKIQGPLTGNSISVDGSISSQYISGLMIALPFQSKKSVLKVNNLKSSPYVEMTIKTLSNFGINITKEGNKFIIAGNQQIKSCKYTIEGDWSSASYWIVAAALGFPLQIKNLNKNSLQADRKILEILEKANCTITFSNDTFSIDGTKRKSIHADLTDCPDLFPALAVYCSLTNGQSVLSGVTRLYHKESNRANTIYSEFSKLGCQIEVLENEMQISGGQLKPMSLKVDSHNDHRIAMSLAILSLFITEEVEISQAECTSKSYPKFWETLEKLAK